LATCRLTQMSAASQTLRHIRSGDGMCRYQARELKSVYVDAQGTYVKLVAHRCHINPMNLFNQIGVIALNVLGEYSTTCENHSNVICQHFVQDRNGGLLAQRNCASDLAFDINVDPRAAQLIRSLLAAKEAAVEGEDYDTAKRLKAAERDLQGLGRQLAQLENSKRRAIQDEDYDRAKLLKNETEALQRRVDAALTQYDIKSPLNARQDDLFSATSPPKRLGSEPPNAKPVNDSDVSSSGYFGDNAILPETSQPALQLKSVYRPEISAVQELGCTTPTPHVLDPGNDPSILLDSHHLPCSPNTQAQPSCNLINNQNELTQSDRISEGDGSERISDTVEARVTTCTENNGRIDGDVETVPLEAFDALEGVPNATDLPAPESLAQSSTDINLVAIRTVLGEYRARCLLSKNWALREAALAKVRLLIYEDYWRRFEDLEHLCEIARIGVQDKISQVYLTALALLDDLSQKLVCHKSKRTDAISALEPALSAVVAKLGENQPRLREKALHALASLSHCEIMGANRVADKVMCSLEKKRPPNNKWRPIATRLDLLKRLAIDFGVENSQVSEAGSRALHLESILAFVETHGCASHTFEEVRLAAKQLVVVIFVIASTVDRARFLEPFLAKLRPKQAKEYQNAIKQSLNNRYDHLEIPSRHQPCEGFASSPGAGQVPVPAQQQTVEEKPFKPLRVADPCDLRDDESQKSEDFEEEQFRDQIMKQLEEKAFSANTCDHFNSQTFSLHMFIRFKKLMRFSECILAALARNIQLKKLSWRNGSVKLVRIWVTKGNSLVTTNYGK